MITGIHHLTLRVCDLDHSRAFYSALPGFDLDQDFPDLGKLRYRVGESGLRVVLKAPLPGTPANDRFTERRIGLDHVALGVSGGREHLHQLEQALRRLGADTDGIHTNRGDSDLGMITFRDPDNVQWEFFQDA